MPTKREEKEGRRLSHDSTPQRVNLITDIICSYMRAHATLMDAYGLLSFRVASVPGVPPGREFLFTSKMYNVLFDKLASEVILPISSEIRHALQKPCTIIATREVEQDASILLVSVSDGFRMDPEIHLPRVSDMTLIFEPDAKDVQSHVSLWPNATSNLQFEYSKKPFRGVNGVGMHTIFLAYSTLDITDAAVVKEHPHNYREQIISKDGVPEWALPTVRSIILGIGNALHSSDDGQLPEPFAIDREVIRSIVTIESTTSRDGMNPYRRAVKTAIRKRMDNEHFRNSLNYMCARFSNGIGDLGWVGAKIPVLNCILPSLLKDVNMSGGNIFLGDVEFGKFTSADYSLARDTTYDRSRWKQNTTLLNIEAVKDRLPRAILSISELLRYTDVSVLRLIKNELEDAERATAYLYRFMNAIRCYCAMELLLANA